MSEQTKSKKPHTNSEKYTQADRDLIRGAREGSLCDFYFDVENFLQGKPIQASIKSVDRYFVEIIEQGGTTVWVAKGAIFAFSVPKTAIPRVRERA